MADQAGGAVIQPQDGFYDAFGNWVPNYNSPDVLPPPPTVGSAIGPGQYQPDASGNTVPDYSILNPANDPNYSTGSFQLTPEQQAQMSAGIASTAAANAAAPVPGASVPPPPPPPSLPNTSTDVPPLPPAPPPLTTSSIVAPPSMSSGPHVASSSSGFSGPSAPGAINFHPTTPTWARGLQRSPYAQAATSSGMSPFAGLGFQSEAPVDPEELKRRQQMQAGQMPAWAGPSF